MNRPLAKVGFIELPAAKSLAFASHQDDLVIKDKWFSDEDIIARTHCNEVLFPDEAARAIMAEAQSIYRNILSVSSLSEEHQMFATLFVQKIPMPDVLFTAFQQTYLPRANAFGDWYANNKLALASLQKLSTS
jgi:hypothetical protein